jgi:hypothetical protein
MSIMDAKILAQFDKLGLIRQWELVDYAEQQVQAQLAEKRV